MNRVLARINQYTIMERLGDEANENDLENIVMHFAKSLPEEVYLCGDEIIGDVESSFGQEDADTILDETVTAWFNEEF